MKLHTNSENARETLLKITCCVTVWSMFSCVLPSRIGCSKNLPSILSKVAFLMFFWITGGFLYAFSWLKLLL